MSDRSAIEGKMSPPGVTLVQEAPKQLESAEFQIKSELPLQMAKPRPPVKADVDYESYIDAYPIKVEIKQQKEQDSFEKRAFSE